MKKDKENIDNSNAKRKKRWSFGKCMKDPSQRATVENDSTRMRSCMSASKKEQNKHVIAIAATATAAADATVVSPQALVAVVRLSTDDRGKKGPEGIKRTSENSISFKGFLVRKRVAATLYSMQALLRAQLDVRSQRAQLAVRSQLAVQPQMRHRQSTERFDNDRRREIHSKRLSTSYDSNRSHTPATPPKSVCGDAFFRPHSNRPSYMANTQSFSAKQRSHCAVRMQKSCSKAQEALNSSIKILHI
ncbi:IQ-DOMAIN 31-like protein [Tanacetum coccineum]